MRKHETSNPTQYIFVYCTLKGISFSIDITILSIKVEHKDETVILQTAASDLVDMGHLNCEKDILESGVLRKSCSCYGNSCPVLNIVLPKDDIRTPQLSSAHW